MSFKRNIVLISSAGLLQAVAPAVTQAEEAQRLEEVMVTARKREESILAVPVTMTALSEQTLEQFKIDDFYSVAERVPGLTIGTGQGSFGGYVVMRGVGHSLRSATTDTSSSLNIDGMQFSSGLAFSAGMFDVAQVEVLKGPQALFFGKNSPGGVIALRTADPGDEREVVFRAGAEYEAEQYQGQVIVSGPVTDTLGMRLGLSYSERDSYFKNKADQDLLAPNHPGGLTPPKNFDEADELITRFTTLWNPTDRFSARFKLNYTDYENTGDAGHQQGTSCPDGTQGYAGFPFMTGDDCKLDDTFSISLLDPDYFPQGIANNGVPYVDRSQWFTTLELNWEITSDLTLTSLTGYWDLDHESLYNACNCSATPTWGVEHTLDREDWTQELRLTSNYDGRWNFMLGGFYQDAEMTSGFRLPISTAITDFAGLPAGILGIGVDSSIDVESVSLFGQVTFDLTDKIELSAGTRYTDEERTASYYEYANTGGTTINPSTPKISNDNFSPEYAITYRPTGELTLFASYRKGFKSGSYNDLLTDLSGNEEPFGDETVEGFEFGVKSLLLDGRLTANASIYSYEYDDMQLGALRIVEGVFTFPIVNAAKSTIEGVEFDASYLVESVPGLILFVGGNYNDAEFDDFDSATCYTGQTIALGCDQNQDPVTGRFGSQDLSGEPLDKAPEWSGFVGFDYTHQMSSGYTLALGATVNYSDDYWTVVSRPDDSTQQDSYTKTSASISLRSPNDTWELALIGKNLEDEITIGNCSVANIQNGSFFSNGMESGFPEQDSIVLNGESICVPEPGREIWLQFTYRM